MAPHFVHVTVVHPRYDTRILLKQCRSLARGGHAQVTLLVADGRGDEDVEGVRIRDVGTPRGGRLGRALFGNLRMWRAIRAARADLVQMHDPELLPLALLLHAAGVRTVFDMHENLPKEILTKEWVRPPLRRALSAVVRRFQRFATRRIPTLFAEHSYAPDFPAARDGTVVLNYPLLDALTGVRRSAPARFTVGYVGAVSGERGALVMVDALRRLRDSGVDAAATFVGPVLEDVRTDEHWRRAVDEGWLRSTGRLAPREAWEQLAACHVGLAVLRPSPNFVDSYPTKLFEYMALGLPVVVSDFPLWRDIVERAGCGLVVDPADAGALAAALRRLHDNPDEALAMGARGRTAATTTYDWKTQFDDLSALYTRLLSR